MKTLYVNDLKPGDTIRGTVHECLSCGSWFIARADAKVCSSACRVALHRENQRMLGKDLATTDETT